MASDKFFSYEDFEKVVNECEGFTTENYEQVIHVFYNFSRGSDERGANTLRETLFTISKTKAFDFVCPYGFRLTNLKALKDFEKIERAVIALTRTPIKLRNK